MGELRSEIWDYLYRASQPQSVSSIAGHLRCDAESIRLAVDHEWFDVTHDVVAIASCREDQLPGAQSVCDPRDVLNQQTMSESESSPDRDLLVRALAEMLERNGYMVTTCLEEEEHQKPPTLGDCRPDVYALKKGSPRIIGAVEVCGGLHDDSTQQRWKALFAAANRPGSHPGYELHILVPSSCLDEAKQQATAWGVTATFHTEKLAD